MSCIAEVLVWSWMITQQRQTGHSPRSFHQSSLEQPMRHHKYRTSAHSIACPCSSNNVKPPNCSHTPSSSLFPGIYLECNQISKYKTNEPLNSILNTITTSGLNMDSQSGIMCSCERGYILVTHNVPHEKVSLQYHNTPASTLLLISPDSIC